MRKLLFSSFIFCVAFQMHSQSLPELQTLYAQGNYEEVLRVLDSPSTSEEQMIWADAQHKLGNFEQAMEGYLATESLGNISFELFLNRGICAFSLGDFQLTRRDLLQAKKRKEDKRIPYYFAAMAYMDRDYKSAATYAEEAILADGNYMEAHYLLGAIFLEQKKFSKAENAFIECIDLRPEFAQSKINLALCFIEQFKFDEAIGLLTSLITSLEEASLADAYYQRGVCHYQMHNSTSACEDWEMATELGDADAKDHVAGICEGNKRKIKRRKEVQMAF